MSEGRPVYVMFIVTDVRWLYQSSEINFVKFCWEIWLKKRIWDTRE